MKISIKGCERNLSAYSNPDNDPRGPWTSGNMAGLLPESQRPNCHYDLINPFTNINYGKPEMGWRYDRNTMSRLIEENRIIWPENENGRPRRKVFLNELSGELSGFSSMVGNDVFTRNGTSELNDVFNSKFFDFPKPIEIIKTFITQVSNDDSYILDFFSGSATTAHAVMQLNAEDGGNRRFICVQLPEPTQEDSEAFKAGYKNICEIGKERIRRAGEKIKEEIESANDQLKLGEEPKNIPDIGFKVFKLDSSNLKKWAPDYDNLESYFDEIENNYVPGRTEWDVVYEIMLKMGLDLTYPVEETEIDGKKVYYVGFGALMMCLDDDITVSVAEGMAKLHKELSPEFWRVVFKDNGFADDCTKTNVKLILVQAGLEEDAFTTV